VCNSLAALGLTLLLAPLLQRTPLMILYFAVAATTWVRREKGTGFLSVLLTVIFAGAFH